MVQFVNKRSGLIFLVADERKDFYFAAGHRLAAEVSAEKPSEPVTVEEKKPVKKKATTKKK